MSGGRFQRSVGFPEASQTLLQPPVEPSRIVAAPWLRNVSISFVGRNTAKHPQNSYIAISRCTSEIERESVNNVIKGEVMLMQSSSSSMIDPNGSSPEKRSRFIFCEPVRSDWLVANTYRGRPIMSRIRGQSKSFIRVWFGSLQKTAGYAINASGGVLW